MGGTGMNQRVRWGILGTGQMAQKFALDLGKVEGAELVAVASRTPERARAFAGPAGSPIALCDYESLWARPDVDVVYIATPISEHSGHMLSCLDHGEAVLCEKAFTVSAPQAETVRSLAAKKRLFLMEAMWTRFLPAMRRARQWLEDGAVGTVRLVTGDLGFDMPFHPASLLFDPALAGGALLSVGVYAVSLGSLVFGAAPVNIRTIGRLGQTGVDEQFSLSLAYPCGGMATFTVSIRTPMNQEARIYGEKGVLRIPKFFAPRSVELWPHGLEPEVYAPAFVGNGYQHEAQAVCACLRSGALESREMPLGETLAVLRTMDAIRQAWGLQYPCEASGNSPA